MSAFRLNAILSTALAVFVCGLTAPLLLAAEEPGFVPLFNGKDLTGWEGDTKLWKVQDGAIVGDSPGIPHNQFLATRKATETLNSACSSVFATARETRESSSAHVGFPRAPKSPDTRPTSARNTGAASTTSPAGTGFSPRPPSLWRRNSANPTGTTTRSALQEITSPSRLTASPPSITASPTPTSPARGSLPCRSTAVPP